MRGTLAKSFKKLRLSGSNALLLMIVLLIAFSCIKPDADIFASIEQGIQEKLSMLK